MLFVQYIEVNFNHARHHVPVIFGEDYTVVSLCRLRVGSEKCQIKTEIQLDTISLAPALTDLPAA